MRKLKPFFFAEQVKEVKEIEEIQSVFQENLNIFGGIIKKMGQTNNVFGSFH
jgi:hypothetical protein